VGFSVAAIEVPMLTGDEETRRKAEYTKCEAAMTLALGKIYDRAFSPEMLGDRPTIHDYRKAMADVVDTAHKTLLNYVGGYSPDELKEMVK
jgi:hypothetical protein